MQPIAIDQLTFTVTGLTDGWTASLAVSQEGEGIALLQVTLESPTPARPPQAVLEWRRPVTDIQGRWHPEIGWNRALGQGWGEGFLSMATLNAPVECFFNLDGRNRLTLALSDALNPVRLQAGVVEETAEFSGRIRFFAGAMTPMTRYDAVLRVDTRDIPYYQALDAVQRWWAAQPGYAPAPVPEAARQPMYSTWYSFHQRLDPDALLAQCRHAKALGCDAIIVDDGWQTLDSRRGYGYCGDWSPERIPEMRHFVDRVHAEGLRCLLWYAVPFIGFHSANYARFAGKYCASSTRRKIGVLDPRFPEVREFLITTYETALRAWDLDGFKLDFVDAFVPDPEFAEVVGGGRDYDAMPAAVDRLLTDILTRLRRQKPDMLVEFRQGYIGPLMRKYG